MVLYFTSSEGYIIYMGADKYENEDLIRYGIPEDLWFHVDDMSSAHVYLRLRKNQRLEDVSEATIHECAQLVKANSIEGCKMKTVTVIYTRWRNLHKTHDMEVGAIGFHDRSKVKSLRIDKDNSIVKELNKTKEIRFPNLCEEQEARAAEFRTELKNERKNQFEMEKKAKKEREANAKIRNYSSIMTEENMKSNADVPSSVDDSAAKDFEDDFM
eukprot:gene10460-14051_t